MSPETFPDGMGLECIEGPTGVGGVVLGVRGAVGEDVVFVGFLGVGVGAHLSELFVLIYIIMIVLMAEMDLNKMRIYI